MGKEQLKYAITIPLGIGLFILFGYLAIIWDLESYAWYIIIGLIVIPMAGLGQFLDKKFKVTGGTVKVAKVAQASGDVVPCPNCKQPVKRGLEFCSFCGTKMFTEILATCPNCKQSVKMGVELCPSCGAKMM